MLLDSNASSICKRPAMKKTISKKKTKRNLVTHLELYTKQSCPAHTHLSQGLSSSILTPMSPQYLASCFSLAFLVVQYSLLSPRMTSLHLDLMIWDSSVPFKKVVSSTSTLSQSCWRYSNVFFFFFFFSAILLFSASSLTLASASFFAFWAACSAWHAFTASSNWARSHCSFLCLYYIFCCCSSSISVLFCKISEWIEENMVIQKRNKLLFSVYVLLI